MDFLPSNFADSPSHVLRCFLLRRVVFLSFAFPCDPVGFDFYICHSHFERLCCKTSVTLMRSVSILYEHLHSDNMNFKTELTSPPPPRFNVCLYDRDLPLKLTPPSPTLVPLFVFCGTLLSRLFFFLRVIVRHDFSTLHCLFRIIIASEFYIRCFPSLLVNSP